MERTEESLQNWELVLNQNIPVWLVSAILITSISKVIANYNTVILRLEMFGFTRSKLCWKRNVTWSLDAEKLKKGMLTDDIV